MNSAQDLLRKFNLTAGHDCPCVEKLHCSGSRSNISLQADGPEFTTLNIDPQRSIMADRKKLLEDAVWQYVASHRPLKLFAICLLSVGSLSGAITAAEKPYRAVVDTGAYLFGVRPNAGDVVLERNAFMAGMFLRELQLSSSAPELTKPNIDLLGKSFTAVGFGDGETRSLLNENPATIQSELLRIREKFEGHLETKGYRIKAFFDLGYHLRSLAEATTGLNREAPVREINGLVLRAYSSAQDSLPYRLPRLPLIEMAQSSPVASDYVVAVVESIRLIKTFLSADV